jgi:putative FmdB family regulatory protein
MPIFEYICRDCDRRFEQLVQGSATPTCPACQGQHLEKQFSVFAVSSREPARSAMPSPCGSCGHPDGPGSCAMN